MVFWESGEAPAIAPPYAPGAHLFSMAPNPLNCLYFRAFRFDPTGERSRSHQGFPLYFLP
jgi:hypothetical protein